MRGSSRRTTGTLQVPLRDFAWDAATIATLRHCALPWFDGVAPDFELTADPLASLRDLGARDRLSLTAQYAAHQAFLQFAGIAEGEFEASDWVVVRKRGQDCRLVRVAARNVDPAAAPPTVVVAQQFAECVGVNDLEALRRSWTRAETIYAEIDERLRRDASADLRWMRLAAAGEIVAPGPAALREMWRASGRIAYADHATPEAVRALGAIDTSVRVIELETEFPIHRYAALANVAPDLARDDRTETAVAEELVSRLSKQRHIVIVGSRLDSSSRKVIEIASAIGAATWLFREDESPLPASSFFVLSPRLAARSALDARLCGMDQRREWIERFVASDPYRRYLDSGEVPAEESETAGVPEPARSYIAALALIGSRVPLEVASAFLRQFLYEKDFTELVIPGLTSVVDNAFVFASEGLRERWRSHIPANARPALCRAAASLSDDITAAHLLIEAGDAGAGIERLQVVRWTSADECVRELVRVPRAMLTPALAAMLAAALIDCGRYRDARDLMNLARETDCDLLLARMERRQGDYAPAVARVDRMTSPSFDAQLLHAELLRLQNRGDDARQRIDSISADTEDERVRLSYERSVLALDLGRPLDDPWFDSEHYLAIRYRTYRALQGGHCEEAETLAAQSLAKARCRTERIDSWLDRIYASFSSGDWEKTRVLATEALIEVDEAQGDRASAGILFTLAYLAADSAQWSVAEHLIRRIRQHYERTVDWPRLFEVDLLDAHLAFCRGRFGDARRFAIAVLQRDNPLAQVSEAAALIADEVDWIERRDTPLRSAGQSGNRELDARHRMIRERCEIESAVTRSERLKLFRSAIRTGRREVAEDIARELGITMSAEPDVAPEIEILRVAASADYPFAPRSFGDASWCFASRNRLGHWSTEGNASFAPADLDAVTFDGSDWFACSDREILFFAGSSRWSTPARQAMASLFRVRAENHRLRRLVDRDDVDRATPVERTHGIIGQSPALRSVFELIDRIAKRDVPVCIQGESGTGKELVARAIHRTSSRRQKPFTALNCAALPENLIESELFGHARGAFTGADRERPGVIETADGGTLFLDEIGEMPLAAQAKLLRFLQEGEFRRVGDSLTRTADVRVVSATNRKLESAVEEGRFREDLYYRVRGVELVMPPLRDRGDDVRLLAQHFLTLERNQHRAGPSLFSAEVESVFGSYRWPGNVRELQNTVRAAHAIAGDASEVQLEHLPERLRNVVPAGPLAGSYQDAVTRFRRDLIERSLVAAAGNQNRAAALLNMSRQALAYQIRELGILVKRSPPQLRL